ncbi:MAG: fatty acid cis/trans isomerase [Granulosicoccus sp.]
MLSPYFSVYRWLHPRGAAATILAVLLVSCASLDNSERRALDGAYGESQVQARARPVSDTLASEFLTNVRPVLEKRCVVCHACYDAACQLKLTSAEGIERGGSKEPVYGPKLVDADPTRLYIDELDTEGWRSRGFHPTLNERAQTPTANLEASLMNRMLDLKANNPQPVASNEPLPAGQMNFSLNNAGFCPTVEEFPHYAANNPFGGMPYALPALADDERATLTDWLANGAQMMNPEPPPEHASAIAEWETRLNGNTDKERLIARYVYEHLFLAHLHFNELVGNGSVWYRLVRSSTPPGEPIVPIATRLPFQDPETEQFWYRLWHDPETVVAKSHLPWELNAERMAWLDSLFFDADFEVDQLPGYSAEVASNPFIVFDQLPVRSRYRFMLENARFTIMGFMKGPVCRGQVALNVIRDHFWVLFVDPENQSVSDIDGFLMEQAHTLEFPAGRSDFASLVGIWSSFAKNNREYLDAKMNTMMASRPNDQRLSLDYLWDGDGNNPNAALTVFRHFDSASVVHGLAGEDPRTAWLINYPLLERIHYLLVAEFDVFGSVGHQLATRLYMDFLRQEGETAYVTLLPRDVRQEVHDSWYQDADEAMREHMKASMSMMGMVEGIDINASDPEAALHKSLLEHLEPVLDDSLSLQHSTVPSAHREPLQRLAALGGRQLAQFPEVALLTVRAEDDSLHLYSVVRHVAHANITSLFAENKNLLPDEDTLDVFRGVVGDYPSAFWHVDESALDSFVSDAAALGSPADYANFMQTHGIRRTHEAFWAHADEVHDLYVEADPIDAGLLDFNRLENR